MKINENSNIRLINNDTYINRLVELHLSAFSNLLSGTIGKRFLRFYYKRIIKDGFIFAYIEDNSMLGFVSGIINEKLLYNIRFYFYAILGIITHIYNPDMILCFIRHIFRIIKLKGVEINSELLSIVVDEHYRGKGIGKILVETLNDFMMKNGVIKYKVFTDMKYSTGHLLYDKLGFILEKELCLIGLILRMYVKELK